MPTYGKVKVNTLTYDSSGSAVDLAVSNIAVKADPTFTGTITAAALTLSGNLQVNGTTTTVASSTMTVADKNIELAKGAANDAAADGGGITLESGDGNKEIKWVNATDYWTFNQGIETTAGEISIKGAEGNNAIFKLTADEGDDNADYWRLVAGSGGDFTLDSKSTGSWVTGITVSGSGNLTGVGTISDSKGDVRAIPQLSKSSAHTIVATDAGQHSINSSGGWVINTSTGFTAGQAITLINNSSGDQTITSTGVTLYNSADGSTPTKLATRGMATVICTASNTYYISGAGLS